VLEVLAIATRQERNIKGKHRLKRKKNGPHLYRTQLFIYKNHKKSAKNGINEFSIGMQDMRLTLQKSWFILGSGEKQNWVVRFHLIGAILTVNLSSRYDCLRLHY
jgi:hypothetical protein